LAEKVHSDICTAVCPGEFMQTLFQNLRYALRQLHKSPGFTLTVVLTLALGIGANAAVFTLFDQVLLRMLPVERPKELVRFNWTGAFSGHMSIFGGASADFFSYPMYKDLRDQNQVFSGILAADRTNIGISWHNQAEDEDAELVSGNYFTLLGLRPVLGRLLTDQDDTTRNANPVLVLSYDYWKTHFAASPDVVGQTVLIEGHPFAILGVAPEGFHSAIGGYKPGVFLPLSMAEIAMPATAHNNNFNDHQSIWLTLVARLKPGITPAQAQNQLGPLWHNLRAYELTLYKSRSDQFRKHFLDDSRLNVVDDSRGFSPDRIDLKTPLIILMSMAGLLVAMCAINVATLLLLRAAGRAREMSMRYALGAKRGRIASQLLTEGLLLGGTGAVAGLALAPLVAKTLVRLLTSASPGNEPYSATIDARVFLFTLSVALVVSLLFSVAPVLHFIRPDLIQALRQSSGTASRGAQRFRKVAVGAQIALSVLLLGGAGLFVRTLDNLRHQEVGFETGHLATFSFDPSDSGYGEDRTKPIVTQALERVRQVPGVLSVAATTDPELAGDFSINDFSVEGHTMVEGENKDFETPWITPDYFATLRQPLLAGREFTSADTAGTPKVAIVNLAFAKRFYGSAQNALGHRVTATPSEPSSSYTAAIVGVTGDIKHQDLRTVVGPTIYQPWLQREHPVGVVIYARTAQSPETVEAAIRQSLHKLDPTLVVADLHSMDAQVDLSTSNERALAFLAIGFSALALVLAAIGLYGVLAYSIEQRTREIGVRLALGAQRIKVVVLVLREMSVIAAISTAIALPAIVALARLFRSQLYGVATYDGLTLGGAAVLSAVMVTLAAVLPARRAASVEPMQALRTE
jgi:putative ABC transport system permease protein